MVKVCISVLLVLVIPCFVFAQDPKEIMIKVNFQNQPITEKVNFKMKLIDANNNIRERTASQFLKRVDPTSWESKRLIRFHSPAELAKSAVLILEKNDADNQQWIYIPAAYSVRRIPTKNRGDRYMGTDFSYEDASSIQINKYTFRLIEDKIIDNQNCFQIEQIPQDKQLSEESLYGKIVQYVDKAKYVIVKADYYDKKGVLIKEFKATQFVKVEDIFRPNHVELKDLRFNHKTIVDFENRIIGREINDYVFSIQSLERSN